MDIYNAAPSASNVAFEPDNLLPIIFQFAIEPERNTALPSEVIEADAFKNVDGEPPNVAGVRILFTVKSAFITASAPMTSKSFTGSKWN